VDLTAGCLRRSFGVFLSVVNLNAELPPRLACQSAIGRCEDRLNHNRQTFGAESEVNTQFFIQDKFKFYSCWAFAAVKRMQVVNGRRRTFIICFFFGLVRINCITNSRGCGPASYRVMSIQSFLSDANSAASQYTPCNHTCSLPYFVAHHLRN
jgi:hypothetical protein